MRRGGGKLLQVSIRVRNEDWDRLGGLARRLPIGRAALAREALRIGVERIAADPLGALERWPEEAPPRRTRRPT